MVAARKSPSQTTFLVRRLRGGVRTPRRIGAIDSRRTYPLRSDGGQLGPGGDRASTKGQCSSRRSAAFDRTCALLGTGRNPGCTLDRAVIRIQSEEHTSELQSQSNL